ncbi:DivIVA domain-containing protein [Bifidobacterium sp. ESL0790]|uniref:DivIVA domain-containing protein n=1 Tax=Bifidobacterium sp. ESL0790 TaxID=2983233 RepID=UPI0023F8578B|nr:DivIVA domain-containing protein [Bifidobacterium sp. ESL0790]WEV72827.1 DivIVA domain-containing protein [Bifidobacterium sp. ESL0790]
MADNTTNNQNSNGIEYTSKRKWGYDPRQVDAFLENAHELYDRDDDELTQQDIQSAAFAFSKGGYVIAEVDAALARLEHAVVDRQTARQISNNGRVAWKAETDRLYQVVREHASRAQKERFARALSKHPSYDIKQVDNLIDEVVVRTSDDLGVKTMTPSEAKDLAGFNSSTVSNAIFVQRKGKKGYDERQVDYYLDSCVQLLSRIESYERLTKYEAANGGAQEPLANRSAGEANQAAMNVPQSVSAQQETSVVTPLFTEQASAAATSATAPAGAQGATFNDVHEEEQKIFAPTPAQNGATSAVPTPASPVVPSLPNEAASASNVPTAGATAGDAQGSSSSLAALANMAQTSQTAAPEQPASFSPQMPPLASDGAGSQANGAKPASASGDDMGIPDISLNSFDSKQGNDVNGQ